jgi:site-specific recombinase XerD
LPVVLTRDEIKRLIGEMDGVPQLVAILLYGAGLRVVECLELRVKDIDFGGKQILLRGKGSKARITMLPATAEPRLQKHLDEVHLLHARDLRRGGARPVTPSAIPSPRILWKTVMISGRFKSSSATPT